MCVNFITAGYMALIATVLGDILPPKRLALAIGLLWSVVGLASIGSTACSGNFSVFKSVFVLIT